MCRIFPRGCTLSLALSCQLFAAHSVDSFSALTNDRFANDPSFIGSGYDFSGVGRTDQGDGRWATLIADNIILTANHFAASGNVTFYPDNNPSSTPVTRTIISSQRIGGTDLRIAHFAEPLPTSIARYDISTIPLSGPSGVPLAFTSPPFAYSVGLTPSSGGYANSSLTNMTVGENHIEFYQEDSELENQSGTVIATTDSIITVKNEMSDPGFTYETHESAANSGDSGSPLLVPNGGELLLFGIAAGNGSNSIFVPGQERDFSVYSYTGNYATEISDYINAHLIPIPEPSTTILLLGGISLILRRSRP